MTVEELNEAISRHPAAESDPEVIDAINALETVKVQDYLDLDAAGYLLVALGHLVEAKGKLDQEPPSAGAYRAKWEISLATNHVRYALKVLDEQKEETCEKS